jgi:DNA-binding transcriptional MerR regulator
MLKNTPPELPEEPGVPREDNEISIGELAIRLEMSQRTIRYYEEIGLLNSIKRIEGGRRVYTQADLRRLKLIKRLKIMGMTLSDMQELEAMWSFEKSKRQGPSSGSWSCWATTSSARRPHRRSQYP